MRLPRVDPAGVPNPPSVGKLEKYVLAHADREGVAVGRIRHWISFMMLSGALEQATASLGGPRFIAKGGVALELRLPTRARSTEEGVGARRKAATRHRLEIDPRPRS